MELMGRPDLPSRGWRNALREGPPTPERQGR